MSVEQATADSPFKGDAKVKRYPAMMSKGAGQSVGREEALELVSLLKDKPYWSGKLPGVSGENPGFSDAPLPSEVISIQSYMTNMVKLLNYFVSL